MNYSYYHIDYGRPDPGSCIEGFPKYVDVLAADGDRLLSVQTRGNHQPAPRLITYDRYVDRSFVKREVDLIWKRHWQIACREEDIPNVGDRINYDVANLSFFVVRAGDNEFRAFHNSCRHRGRKICDGKESGNILQCAFHGWVYGLDGKLQWMPLEQEFPHVNKEKFGLHEVKVARWGGNVFINPDAEAPPFEATLGPLAEHFIDFPLERRYTAQHIRKKIRCNWKAAQEAFNEAYHTVHTHYDGMPMFGSAATQIDVWEDRHVHISRLIAPGMVVDPYIADRVDSQEGLRVFCSAYGYAPPPADRGLTPSDARKYAAERQRQRLEESTGLDYSGMPPNFFLDMTKYHVFPNYHAWWGEMMPWWYRFLPYGEDPDLCTMEIRVLMPIPADGKAPPPAEALEIDFDQEGRDFPELGAIGHLVDQDFSNMVAVQMGFKAAAEGEAFLTLAKEAENQICHFHEVYDKIMGIDNNR